MSQKSMSRRFWPRTHFATIVCALFCFSIGSAIPVAAQTADSYIVVDAGSGRVLTAMNPDSQLYPASMTKIMTLFLTFEALSQGRLSLKTMLPVSELAAEQSPSKLGVRAGSSISVENCIYAAVTLSANDCAVILAEGIGGSEDEFARMMTSRAHSLGMVNTHFNNANGLPDEGQLTTARDMATLAEAMIQRFPRYYPYFSTRVFTYNGIQHANHNHLMSRYPGMDGIKTGFIRASGFNLTASAVRQNHRLIAVVFGGTSAVARDNYMANLLDDGFRRIAGQPIAPEMRAAPQIASTEQKPEPAQSNVSGKSGQVAGVALAEAGDAVEQNEGEGNLGAMAAEAAATPEPVTPAAPPVIPVETAKGEETNIPASPASIPQAAEAEIAPSPAKTAPALSEGDAEFPEPPPHHAPNVAVKKVSFTPPRPVKSTKWSVQIGTYSSKAVSDAILKKAIASLPQDIRPSAQELSLPLHVHRKKAYKAELTGFDEMGAKKACSVLTHCTTIKPL